MGGSTVANFLSVLHSIGIETNFLFGGGGGGGGGGRCFVF